MSNPTGSITQPKGFRTAGGTCGVKASGKPDLTLIVADGMCSAAAVFTTNSFKGGPVLVGMQHLPEGRGRAQAIVCQSGNANVATMGRNGQDDALRMCEAAAAVAGCRPQEVLPASTGVIGRPLPIDKIVAGIADLGSGLGIGAAFDQDAAEGILTTDLVIKHTVQRFSLTGHPHPHACTIGGIGKGSGMIAPSMATMLIFLTTDAAISPDALHAALQQANAASFNRMSVDSDTSTSDTAYVLASGAAGNPIIKSEADPNFRGFTDALTAACRDLADQVVRDGEGATRTFEVHVKGAASVEDADRIGRAVTDSPLVKCAIHGLDPNWGRLVMAAGKSGATLDPNRFVVTIEGTTVFANGLPAVTDPEALDQLATQMDTDRVHITLDAQLGDAEAIWLGCDLSRQYIAINADYTT
ncbi:MAG: bifunctional glutamate N-acetyltransferase/amino-acid acetyltransferase ArgJ [Planctomycetota bacterium]